MELKFVTKIVIIALVGSCINSNAMTKSGAEQEHFTRVRLLKDILAARENPDNADVDYLKKALLVCAKIEYGRFHSESEVVVTKAVPLLTGMELSDFEGLGNPTVLYGFNADQIIRGYHGVLTLGAKNLSNSSINAYMDKLDDAEAATLVKTLAPRFEASLVKRAGR